MVYGALRDYIHDNGAHFTDINEVFRAIDDVQLKYNWLVSEPWDFHAANQDIEYRFLEDHTWLSGEELTELMKNDGGCHQWVWGVFSGFPKDVTLEQVFKYPLPCAEGKGRFWKNPLVLQHPLAEIEIVAFDSSLTLFMSKDRALVDKFRKAFPMSVDLAEDNESHK